VVGEAPAPKKAPKAPKAKLPEWEDKVWSPAFKIEGRQAHAETMSAGVAKSVIEQLTKRATSSEVANAGFLAVTSLSLHSSAAGSIWSVVCYSRLVSLSGQKSQTRRKIYTYTNSVMKNLRAGKGWVRARPY